MVLAKLLSKWRSITDRAVESIKAEAGTLLETQRWRRDLVGGPKGVPWPFMNQAEKLRDLFLENGLYKPWDSAPLSLRRMFYMHL